MIETDEKGQKQIQDLVDSLDTKDWNEWETQFIETIDDKPYSNLSTRQKAIITRLHEKLS